MKSDEHKFNKQIRELNKKEEKRKDYDNNEMDVIEPRILGGCLILVLGFALIAAVSIIKWFCQ